MCLPLVYITHDHSPQEIQAKYFASCCTDFQYYLQVHMVKTAFTLFKSLCYLNITSSILICQYNLP